MNRKQAIRLSLLGYLLIILNGCGDGSSKESPKTQNQQEVGVNNAGTDKKAPVITLKGDSQVDIIQDSAYKELGATAVDAEGNPFTRSNPVLGGNRYEKSNNKAYKT